MKKLLICLTLMTTITSANAGNCQFPQSGIIIITTPEGQAYEKCIEREIIKRPGESKFDYLNRQEEGGHCPACIYARAMLEGRIPYPSTTGNTDPVILAGERMALHAGGSSFDYKEIK